MNKLLTVVAAALVGLTINVSAIPANAAESGRSLIDIDINIGGGAGHGPIEKRDRVAECVQQAQSNRDYGHKLNKANNTQSNMSSMLGYVQVESDFKKARRTCFIRNRLAKL